MIDDYEKESEGVYRFTGFKGDENSKVIEKLKDYNDKMAYYNDIMVNEDDKMLILSTCNTDWTRVIAVYIKVKM